MLHSKGHVDTTCPLRHSSWSFNKPIVTLKDAVRGGGLVVSVLAFYSNDPSSNPAGFLNFLNENTKMNEKRGRDWPIFKTLKAARTVVQRIPHNQEVVG